MKSSKTPSSSQPAAAPLATVAGSALDNSVNTNYLAYVSASAAAAGIKTQQADDDLGTGEEDSSNIEYELSLYDFAGGDTDSVEETFGVMQRSPLLSDIQVVSNEIVYDATGLPSSKIVFKVKNSSGELLKAVNVRVEKK